jgi:hypothetical protein
MLEVFCFLTFFISSRTFDSMNSMIFLKYVLENINKICKYILSKMSNSLIFEPLYILFRLVFFFCSTLSEFENFLLCKRILINVTTCQNDTSNFKDFKRTKKTLYSCVNWALYGTRGPLKRSFHPREAQFTYELVP